MPTRESSHLRVLLLGAGKRLSLVERLFAAAHDESIGIEVLSVENEPQVPVAALTQVVQGPAFTATEFGAFLVDLATREGIDLAVPFMDSATVALAESRDRLAAVGCQAVVSSLELCRAMEDKLEADKWFRAAGLPTPPLDGYPLIVKRRTGYGSRDQCVVHDEAELEAFLGSHGRGAYFSQSFVEGNEYTVDAYVSRDGRLLGSMSRRRLHVVDGEVEVSRSVRHESILALSRQILSAPGWAGPITLQFIDAAEGPLVLEVNPRFGGGVTHAIHCGLDMARWLVREALGRPVEAMDGWLENSLMTRCRRDVFHDDPH